MTPKEACEYLRTVLDRAGSVSAILVNLHEILRRAEDQLEREQVTWEEIHETLHVARRDGKYIGHVDTMSGDYWYVNLLQNCGRSYDTLEEAKAKLCGGGK